MPPGDLTGQIDQPDSDTPVVCPWCIGSGLMRDYHDCEWGVPVSEDRLLFEFLTLEGAQAGLSWSTILKRREGYRKAYDGFDPEAVSIYGSKDIARLLSDPGIIRNRLKVEASVRNSRAFLETAALHGSFARYMWGFVDGSPLQSRLKSMKDMPATSPVSDSMSRDLKRRGFSFVGSTICYAHMQAVGMVNDHLTLCFRHGQIESLGRGFRLS
jgi:DNA-3-methyladenine glycosylase I